MLDQKRTPGVSHQELQQMLPMFQVTPLLRTVSENVYLGHLCSKGPSHLQMPIPSVVRFHIIGQSEQHGDVNLAFECFSLNDCLKNRCSFGVRKRHFAKSLLSEQISQCAL